MPPSEQTEHIYVRFWEGAPAVQGRLVGTSPIMHMVKNTGEEMQRVLQAVLEDRYKKLVANGLLQEMTIVENNHMGVLQAKTTPNARERLHAFLQKQKWGFAEKNTVQERTREPEREAIDWNAHVPF